MAVYAAVFSPTGTSQKGAWAIASALGEATLIDATCAPAPQQGFTPEDLVVLGPRSMAAGYSKGP